MDTATILLDDLSAPRGACSLMVTARRLVVSSPHFQRANPSANPTYPDQYGRPGALYDWGWLAILAPALDSSGLHCLHLMCHEICLHCRHTGLLAKLGYPHGMHDGAEGMEVGFRGYQALLTWHGPGLPPAHISLTVTKSDL